MELLLSLLDFCRAISLKGWQLSARNKSSANQFVLEAF
jgi:hypothetical protein